MNKEDYRAMDEYFASGNRIADAQLAAVEAALFAEDAFGVSIPENLMIPERLRDRAAMAALIDQLSASGGRSS